MQTKIHIIGSVGSGKTTFARRLSEKTGIACFELDNVVWKRRENEEIHDVKRTPEERDNYFATLLNREAWIIEGVHSFDWVMKSIQEADVILVIDTKYFVRIYRIIRRYLLQKLGREKANYVPSLKIFWKMFKWNHQFEKEKVAILKKLEMYNDNVVSLPNNKALEKYLVGEKINGVRDGFKKAGGI
ncbi:AAA family ATPase [Virgibacillus flavescens]|uniref:AAA family ATPase n=1 Tax=Virgibacillus flavescens TaxID=1611422 RepID=UPI003D328A0C